MNITDFFEHLASFNLKISNRHKVCSVRHFWALFNQKRLQSTLFCLGNNNLAFGFLAIFFLLIFFIVLRSLFLGTVTILNFFLAPHLIWHPRLLITRVILPVIMRTSVDTVVEANSSGSVLCWHEDTLLLTGEAANYTICR